ncbi:hypothetical protein ABKA04_009562 [Annulohypoxylon sp. FPYF3050]
MQFSTVLLVAFTSTTTMANYNISMYQHRNCFFKAGKVCTNLDARTCCKSDGDKYKSAKFVEVGGGKSSIDQLKLYTDKDCGSAAVQQKAGNSCVNHNKKEVLSSQVFVIVHDSDEEDMAPVKVVEPDEVFMEEGRFRYTVKRDSAEGRRYEELENIEDQLEYLREFGRREEITENVE